MRQASRALLVLLGFSALFVLLFSPVLSSGRLLGTTDAVLYYYPAWFTRPVGWTQLLYSGYPVQGDPQAMSWLPLAWLTRALPGGWNVFVLSAYVLAASFSYGYAYRVTRSPLASGVAGVTYGMSGFAIAHLDHASILHTLAWLPLVFWALEGLREGARGVWWVVLAVAVANALLAGHPQIFCYAMVLAGAYALVRARGARAGRPRFLLRSGLAVLCGVGLGAVMWVPMLELATLSLRGAMARADFFQYALEWAQLPQLLIPFAFGGAVGLPGAALGTSYFGPGIPAEVTGSVGVFAFAMGGVAFVRAAGPDEIPLVRFWAAVALVSVLLALGEGGLLGNVLFHVPGVNRFRIPPRHLFELALAAAALSALGVAALERAARPERAALALRAAAGAVALFVIALVAASVVASSGLFAEEMYRAGVEASRVSPLRSPAVALQAAGLAGLLVMLVLWSRVRARTALGALLVAGLALALASNAFLAGWRMSAEPEESFTMPAALAPLRARLAENGQRLLPMTFDAPNTAAPPNRTLLWEIPSAMGYGPLPLGAVAEVLGLSAAHFASPEDMARVLGPADVSLDVLATRYVLVPDDTRVSDIRARRARYLPPTREAVPQWLSVRQLLDRSPRWKRQEGLPGAALYENTRALPRAWLVGRVEVVEPEVAREVVRTGRLPSGARFDPARIALVEAPLTRPLGCVRRCGTVEVVALEDSEVVLRVDAAHAALLVLSDVDYPGWQASVDGAPREILRTNALLRGVPVFPGEREVRFSFRSASFRLGAGVSLAALAVVLLVSSFVAVVSVRQARIGRPRAASGRLP